MKNKKANLNEVAGGGFFSSLKKGAGKALQAGKKFAGSEAGKKLMKTGMGAISKKFGLEPSEEQVENEDER
jgi:hypothetical protein